MSYLGEVIESEFEKIQDEQIRKAFFLLKEYGELQAGTWNQVMDAKTKKRQIDKQKEVSDVSSLP